MDKWDGFASGFRTEGKGKWKGFMPWWVVVGSGHESFCQISFFQRCILASFKIVMDVFWFDCFYLFGGPGWRES